jgi:heme oxygenase
MSAGVVRILPDWERRSRRRAILADLRKLGERPQVARQVTLDFHNILGVVYVLEGSRLGGRVLLGKAMQSGDPVVRSATAYLRHGAHEPFWSSFLAILEHEGRSLCHEGRVVDGARLAFRLFEESAARFAGTTA